MAKYNHRIFEMYDSRDEAVQALTPRTASSETATDDPAIWNLNVLDASQSASLTLVRFKKSLSGADNPTRDLQKDFAKLTDKLSPGSKLLLDFTDLDAISAASIETLASFNQHLRHRGSRIVLCCLAPEVRSSFFPKRE